MRHLHVMVAAFAIAASGVAHAQAAKAPRPLDLTAPMTEQTTMSGSLIKPRATPWDPSLTRSIEPRGTWFGARSSFAWMGRHERHAGLHRHHRHNEHHHHRHH